jgi:hypothetical protein
VALIHKARASRFGPQDIFGAFDIVGLSEGSFNLEQVTTLSNRAARRRKVEGAMRRLFRARGSLPAWLHAHVWAWGRTKSRGLGFTIDTYLGGRSWGEERFVPSSEVP